ncbi:MAG: AI-2E family transporter [Pyrinomonadaceae bacterium]|nr:AI-2E family transporter [Pyrinomonadaceae bacterium]
MNKQRSLGRWLALLSATVAALALCFLMLWPFLDVLAWAAVLVILFYPVHRRLTLRLKDRPGTSALISCLLVIFVILLPLTFITLALVNELSGIAGKVQGFISSLLDPNLPLSGPLLEKLGQYVDLEQLRSHQFIEERLRNMSGTIARQTLGFVGGALGIVVQIIFVIFTMYYLFRDGDKIIRALPDILPLEREQSEEIIARTTDVISASVYGVLIISAIQGALGGVGFLIVGLPSALVWGVIMIVLSMIPVAGAFVVWVPAALYLAATGQWGKALFLTIWGALVIGSVDNFLRPKLVGEKTKLHELFIFFSVLGGLQVFGVLGLILGPVVLAVAIALLDVVRQADRPLSAPPVPETLAEQTVFKEEPAV